MQTVTELFIIKNAVSVHLDGKWTLRLAGWSVQFYCYMLSYVALDFNYSAHSLRINVPSTVVHGTFLKIGVIMHLLSTDNCTCRCDVTVSLYSFQNTCHSWFIVTLIAAVLITAVHVFIIRLMV